MLKSAGAQIWKFSPPEGSATDHEAKSVEIEPATTQDDGQSVEVKERRKKKKRAKDSEETVALEIEDTPGE